MPSVFSTLSLTPQALPHNSAEYLGLDPDGARAWKMIMVAEEDALRLLTRPDIKHSDPLVGIRVLGFLLLQVADQRERSPFSTAYDRLIEEIVSGSRLVDGKPLTTDQRLQQLGLDYRNVMFRTFRSNTDPEKTPSHRASRPSFDIEKKRILDTLEYDPSPTTSMAKTQALLRDGHRCVISGSFDCDSTDHITGVEEERAAIGRETATTEVAHLFSQTAPKGKDDLASALPFLQMFGLGEIAGQLAINPNLLDNVLTMADSFHTLYDKFYFWLEEVPNMPYTYDVVSPKRSFWVMALKPRRRITLTISARLTPNERRNFKLPNRELMALRAACARVANMSGAVEQRDNLLRDEEDFQVLASDGADAEYLASLLRLRTSTPIAMSVNEDQVDQASSRVSIFPQTPAPPLTNTTRLRAQELLSKFASQRWQLKSGLGARYLYEPASSFLSIDECTRLLDFFHLIREPGQISTVLPLWEFLGTDGTQLGELVVQSNWVFEQEAAGRQAEHAVDSERKREVDIPTHTLA